MKRIRIIALVMALLMASVSIPVKADEKAELYGGWKSDLVFDGLIGSDPNDIIPMMAFMNEGGKRITGTLSFPDWNNTAEGTYTFTWVFTPTDDQYQTKTGTFNVRFLPGTDNVVEEPTTPSLTAIAVQLGTRTSYDINLNDKVPGCAYAWNSSNVKVVTVNNKNGLLKAVSEGTATVTCEITYPDAATQTLRSEVTVGYDDNAPLLTEDDLNLNTGDVFDVNLENKVAKSKYRWVSSNKSVVTVNSANGIVTAKAPGTAYVTCTITTPGNQVIVLRADISVTAPPEATE